MIINEGIATMIIAISKMMMTSGGSITIAQRRPHLHIGLTARMTITTTAMTATTVGTGAERRKIYNNNHLRRVTARLICNNMNAQLGIFQSRY